MGGGRGGTYENPLVRSHVTGLEHLNSRHGLLQGAGQQIVLTLNNIGLKSSVGDPDLHDFGPPGSGSISLRYGSGSFLAS